MILAYDRKTEKRIFRDIDFIFIVINAALVIIGYGLSVSTGGASIQTMKIIKSFVLILSFIFLVKNIDLTRNSIPFPNFILIFIFSFWIVLMSFFGDDVFFSIRRSTDLLFPLIYVYVAVHNLVTKYDVFSILLAFTKAMNFVYAIPLFCYLVGGGSLTTSNIYGNRFVFVSNQYGWASSVFLLSAIDLWLNVKLKKAFKIYLVIFSLLAIYLLLISGNRSSWVSVLMATIILIFRLKKLRWDFKILLLMIPLFFTVWMISIPESSLNYRLNLTQTQVSKGERRFEIAKIGFAHFKENKSEWITGVGMFNYKEIMPDMTASDYHDSYLEVLFGGGIILFILFVSFMVINPLRHYFIYYSKYLTLLPPLAIIPFFESNLTGGQFLFFPWFMYVLLLNINPQRNYLTVKKHNLLVQQNAY